MTKHSMGLSRGQNHFIISSIIRVDTNRQVSPKHNISAWICGMCQAAILSRGPGSRTANLPWALLFFVVAANTHTRTRVRDSTRNQHTTQLLQALRAALTSVDKRGVALDFQRL